MADNTNSVEQSKGKLRDKSRRPSRKNKKKKNSKNSSLKFDIAVPRNMHQKNGLPGYCERPNEVFPSNIWQDERLNFPEIQRETHVNFTPVSYPPLQCQSPQFLNSVTSSPYGRQNIECQQCKLLENENEQLKCALYNVSCMNSFNSGPEIDIVFQNFALASRYRTDVERFLISLLSNKQCANGDDKKEENLDDLFIVNAEASFPDPYNDSLPIYDTTADDVLGDVEEKKSFRPSFRPKCFNCLGSHTLAECPEEHDYDKIAERRAERLASTPSSVRYHAKEHSFHTFKPGIISKELRNALELDKSQVPPYIYRMRVLGYPPGWLEEANVKTSGLVMYGKADNSEESGHTGEEKRIQTKYDPEKLIDFPGFNVPLCPDLIDESTQLGFPPFSEYQLRCHMEAALPMKGRKSKKRKWEDETADVQQDSKRASVVDDMDLDCDPVGGFSVVDEWGDSPPLPPENIELAPPPPPPTSPPLPPLPPLPPTDDSLSSDGSKHTAPLPMDDLVIIDEFCSRDSPSLTELEEQKKLLMMALNSDVCDSNELTEQDEDLPSGTNCDNSFVPLDVSQSTNTSANLSLTFGSPQFPSFSSCSKLPDFSKFKEGIQGQLFVEDEKTPSGHFEKMKNLLNEIRQKRTL